MNIPQSDALFVIVNEPIKLIRVYKFPYLIIPNRDKDKPLRAFKPTRCVFLETSIIIEISGGQKLGTKKFLPEYVEFCRSGKFVYESWQEEENEYPFIMTTQDDPKTFLILSEDFNRNPLPIKDEVLLSVFPISMYRGFTFDCGNTSFKYPD